MIDKNLMNVYKNFTFFTELSLVMEKTEKFMEKVMENHGIFCNLKSANPAIAKKP